MHYCPNCKKEFEGNSCPDCGFWAIPLKQETGKPSAFIAVAHLVAVLAIIATGICVYFFVVASPYILLDIFLSNKFSVYNVSEIEFGYTQEQVLKILGKPYNETGDKWQYYDDKFISAANEIKKCNEEIAKALENNDKNKFERYVEKLSELQEKYKDLTYKYIEVNFSYEEEVYKVSSVFLDVNHNANTEKEVNNLKVEIGTFDYYVDNAFNENRNVLYGNNLNKISYVAVFTDGSYCKSFINSINSKYEIADSKLKLQWFDDFSEYETIGNINKIGEISADGTWNTTDKNITEITLSNHVTSIDNSAFSGCDKLTSITIFNSVKVIGANAFYGCSKLKDITFNGTKLQWETIDKDSDWDHGTGNYTIHCTDGDISK